MATDSAQVVGNCREPVVHARIATKNSLAVAMSFPCGGEWFSGHFPDFPVLPGVAQLFFLRRFARSAFDDFPEVAAYRRIKFRRLVRPDELVRLEVVRKGVQSFSFEMTVENDIAFCGSVEGLEGTEIGAHDETDFDLCAPLPPSVVLDLLPHRPPMVLLSDVLSVEVPNAASAVADTSPSSIFYEDALRGVPSCVALEYMAQTMALAVGAERRKKGKTPKVGFVLGTRRLDVRVPCFDSSRRYVTAVKCTYSDEEFAAFDCTVAAPSGKTVAAAAITAFQPLEEPLEFAEKMRKLNDR